MSIIRTSKTVHYEINGKRYDRIEDVPPEFREMIRQLNENPEAFRNKTVAAVTTSVSGGIGGDPAGSSFADHREKFLRETVLPNLHLLDPKAQAEVLREIGGETETQPSQRSTIIWIIVYVLVGLLLLFGYNAIRNMVVAP
ncbi:MAG: hypothetical protein OEW15_14990 [Nitrospirota bacterium]|nr:hypothetical protein [Nitrospirota bacterium]